MTSLLTSLTKQKKNGDIDFVKAGDRLFYVKNIKNSKYSVIFYDNKYRQDTFNWADKLFTVKAEQHLLKESSSGTGLLNTDIEVERLQKIIDFLTV